MEKFNSLFLSNLPSDENKEFQIEKIRSLLKWAGGKRWLVPYLKPLWKNSSKSRFVEPFCGSLAVTFGLLPKKALLNDINPHLINFYKQVKAGLKITISMKYDKELYYSYRDRFNELITTGKWNTEEGALLFYYLNHTGYNGLCRFNSSGLFNVPFGKYKSVNYIHDFTSYKKIMEDWEFTTLDFSQLEVNQDDLVYIDPPYDVEFTHYSVNGFSWKDQERVALWAYNLPSPVVITNQATERILKLYKEIGFDLKMAEVPRYINCIGDKRGTVKEVIGIKGI